MDAINTFVFEIWPKIPDIIGGVVIVCLAAYSVWSIFFKKEMQTASIPEPDDEPMVDPQELGEAIADAINEVQHKDDQIT